jgi:hypothetical protein
MITLVRPFGVIYRAIQSAWYQMTHRGALGTATT